MNYVPSSGYDAIGGTASAVPQKEEIILRITARDDNPDLIVIFPARAVGMVIAELQSALAKIRWATKVLPQ